jgi:hypothetical protein
MNPPSPLLPFLLPNSRIWAGIRRYSWIDADPINKQDQSFRDEGSLLGTASSELQNRVHQFNSGRGLHF